ncbi:hypothetical protein JCGZ_22459 [Jatropha curcas]|uniref:Uncharacterized protein n=1 Tax=Jatropha curcas TaxID=180498 RepID=A0A067JTX0_JATCU|nr:hypothetical protein JCGZ_22459 [Jatropha curcas]
MAGLQQYYFFPTDFYYPRPQSVHVDTAQKAALPLQIQKQDISSDDDVKNPATSSLVLYTGNYKAISAVKKRNA